MKKFFIKELRMSSAVEALMSGLAAIVLAAASFTLVFAASKAQRIVISEKNAQLQMRTAVEYINAKLRQNDAAGLIKIEKFNDENTIVICDIENGDETRIYYDNGGIQEDSGSPVQIASAEGMMIDYDESRNTITYVVSYRRGLKKESVSMTLRLNCL